MRKVVLFVVAMAATLAWAGGTASASELVGTEGPDLLVGISASEAFGLGDDDILQEEGVGAGRGEDRALYGEAGNDGVYGENGDDRVSGGAGNDDVSGGVGADIVLGDDGNDFVDDGPPFDAVGDAIYGGAGNDGMDAYNDPAVADTVDCGPGEDVVYTDGLDVIAADCEEVLPGPVADSDDLLPYALPALYY